MSPMQGFFFPHFLDGLLPPTEYLYQFSFHSYTAENDLFVYINLQHPNAFKHYSYNQMCCSVPNFKILQKHVFTLQKNSVFKYIPRFLILKALQGKYNRSWLELFQK